MLDFNKLSSVLSDLKKSQDAEEDVRQGARDASLFIYAKDGQWDPYAVTKMNGRYRGTFDMCTPAVDQIVGEIDQSDFTLNVRPSSGESSMEVSKVLSGLIRNIRNISNFDDGVLPKIARGCVVSGIDAFEIITDYCDADAFDQDLFIRRVPNAVDCVFFDPDSTTQDRSDATWVIKLTSYTRDAFEIEFGEDASFEGVDSGEQATAFYNKADTILVGQIYYKKPKKIKLFKMSDGSVYRDDDKLQSVIDELEQSNITVVDERERETFEVKSRIFSNKAWLTKEQDTVFNMLPIIPVYGNFEVIESKPVFSGKVSGLMDHQRALNYATSRDIEDGALSPAPTIWMTKKMAAGNDYSKMNTDRAPVRFYNIDDTSPGLSPQFTGGAQPSTGLQTTIANMQQMFNISSNTFDAQAGNANPRQSGIAGAQQIEAGNTGSIKWYKCLQVALTQAGKVIINAIPKVYDATRQARILEEDGTTRMSMLNQEIYDTQSGKVVTLNDLSRGDYDVVCDFGPAFKSQQEKTAQAFLELASLDPTIIQQGKDILIKNLASPGMEQLGERVRDGMVNAGAILDEQLTEEELAKVTQARQAAAQQPQQPDAMMIAAQAEMQKAQADQMAAQSKQAEIQGKIQIESQKLKLEMEKLNIRKQEMQLDAAKFEREKSDKYNKDASDIMQNQEKINMQKQKQQFEMMMSTMQQKQNEINSAFNNLKTLKDAMSVESATVADSTTESQIKDINELQDD